MNRVVHFEIHADDTARAIKFYTDTFGWEIKKWDMGQMEYYLVTTGKDGDKGWPGINGGLLKRDKPLTGEGYRGYVCTMDVENLDEMMKKVIANGGKMDSDKVEIPQMGWMCYCFDTEGNRFGMMQAMTPSAEPQL